MTTFGNGVYLDRAFTLIKKISQDSADSIVTILHFLADAAFHELKRRFAIAPIFKLLDPSCQFMVEGDASDKGVLSQRAQGDQKLHPCAFFSRLPLLVS